MKKVKYTKAPKEVEEALDRGKIIPSFIPSPENLILKNPPADLELSLEEIAKFAGKRAKKPTNIYLSVKTIEKFKSAAKKSGGRYQTMISDTLDAYANKFL